MTLFLALYLDSNYFSADSPLLNMPSIKVSWENNSQTTTMAKFGTTGGSAVKKKNFIILESVWHCLQWCSLGHWMNLQESQYMLQTSNTIYLLPIWSVWCCERSAVGGAFRRLHQFGCAKSKRGVCWVKCGEGDEEGCKQHLPKPPFSSTDGRWKRGCTLILRHVDAVRGFHKWSLSEPPRVGPSSDRSTPIIIPSHSIQDLSEISSDRNLMSLPPTLKLCQRCTCTQILNTISSCYLPKVWKYPLCTHPFGLLSLFHH